MMIKSVIRPSTMDPQHLRDLTSSQLGCVMGALARSLVLVEASLLAARHHSKPCESIVNHGTILIKRSLSTSTGVRAVAALHSEITSYPSSLFTTVNLPSVAALIIFNNRCNYNHVDSTCVSAFSTSLVKLLAEEVSSNTELTSR